MCLCLPSCLVPSPRGGYAWYFTLLNAAVVGFVLSFIQIHLPGIARFLSAAA